jgi:ABC-type transport system substrate-binding protein
VAAIRTGDVDIVQSLPTDQVNTVKDAGLNIVSQEQASTYIIDDYSPKGVLSDQRVRQALNYAVDKESLVKNINGGFGSIADGQNMGKSTIGYCSQVTAYPFDANKAKQLLSEAGYNGAPLTMDSSEGYIPNDRQLAEAFVGMAGNVGVKVNLKVYEFATYLDRYFGKPEGRGDLFAWNTSNYPFLDGIISLSYWLSTPPSHPTGFANKDYDTAMNAALTETDPAKRLADMCDAAKVFKDQAPVIFVLHPPDVWAVSKKVNNFVVGKDGIPILTDTTVSK